MPTITLITIIDAPIERVFDLSRSIDLHKISTSQSNEEAIAGRMSGLIELNETVTWRSTHFAITQTLQSKITEFNRPHYFVDEMLQGVFSSIHHLHLFGVESGMTQMRDEFRYEAPLGLIGRLADCLFLQSYLTRLLKKRNAAIKAFAESNEYKALLS